MSVVPCNNGVLECSDITSESFGKYSHITSESSGKHHVTVVSSREHCLPTRRCLAASGKRRRRHHNTSVSSGPLVDCFSSCHENTVTRSGDLTSVRQSRSFNQSRKSSVANSANQSGKVPSSSPAEMFAANDTTVECAVQGYVSLVIDATNVS
jgi:hypothetical protein